MGDDQPHAEWPDKTKLDFCIERLGTSKGDEAYPVGVEWKGDAASWEIWKTFIMDRYAPNQDATDRKVRDAINDYAVARVNVTSGS